MKRLAIFSSKRLTDGPVPYVPVPRLAAGQLTVRHVRVPRLAALAGAMALFAGLLLAGCGQDSAGDASPAPEPAATEKSEAAASVEEYTLRGTILGLDQDAKAAVINHEEIEGWMDAMTMTFPVKDDADWSKLKVGSKIRATVFVSDDEVYIGGVEIQTE